MLGSSRFCSATSSEPTLGVFHELCKCVWGDRLRRHQVLASWSVLVPCNLISPKFPMHKTKFAPVMFRFRCVCVYFASRFSPCLFCQRRSPKCKAEANAALFCAWKCIVFSDPGELIFPAFTLKHQVRAASWDSCSTHPAPQPKRKQNYSIWYANMFVCVHVLCACEWCAEIELS